MKNLLSKEHYSYKIHILLTKSGAYVPPPSMADNAHLQQTQLHSYNYS